MARSACPRSFDRTWGATRLPHSKEPPGGAAPNVYDVRDIVADPQFAALGTITRVADPELGSMAMQNLLFRLSSNPGAIRWTGRGHGADTDEVLSEIGVEPDELVRLRHQGVI